MRSSHILVFEKIELLMIIACRQSRVLLELRNVSRIIRLRFAVPDGPSRQIGASNQIVVPASLYATVIVAFDYSVSVKPFWVDAIAEAAKKPL